MAQTDRLGLPLLAAGQAQKEVMHNEALALLDMAVALTIESADLATPPAFPEPGQCWIVASGATDEWLARDGEIAGWTANGWRFLAPLQGWRGWVVDRSHMVRFGGAGWIDDASRTDGYYVAGERIVGARHPAIADVAGGVAEDVEARATINSVLAALRGHGLINA